MLVFGCTNGEGDEPNVLPEPESMSSTGPATTDPTIATTADPSMSTTTMTDSGPPTETGDDTAFPATYRFDCVDIQGVGDADGTAFQAQVLENTWSADISNFKLNILLEVESRDSAAGEAKLGIRSGVGSSMAGMCAQADTISDIIDVPFSSDDVRWEPTSAAGECSTAASGAGGNTYQMELGPERVVYIYAEDDDTTTFNCTPAATPDAVPVRGVVAEVSTDPSERNIAGTLSGCLLESEAMTLCSCLAECSGDGPDDLQPDGVCAGCPVGATPLAVLLGGVNPSANCTALMGEPALDLRLGFTASRLPDVPASCG